MKCPLCNRVYVTAAVGIKLYQSENECAICMTKGNTMVALPCGHQFCEQDLKKIGLTIRRTHIPDVSPPVLTSRGINRETSASRGETSASRARRTLFISQRRRRQRQARLMSNPIFNRIRIVAPSRTINVSARNRKRCGWCGHFGHTIRKCRQHEHQCGCQSGCRTNAHKRKLRRKRRCAGCGKRGHIISSCHTVLSS